MKWFFVCFFFLREIFTFLSGLLILGEKVQSYLPLTLHGQFVAYSCAISAVINAIKFLVRVTVRLLNLILYFHINIICSSIVVLN